MNGYILPLLCPDCGGCLEHVNASNPTMAEAIAIARCVSCKKQPEFSVLVRLVPMPRASRFAA